MSLQEESTAATAKLSATDATTTPTRDRNPGQTTAPPAPTLRISEIFASIQGESSRIGWPTVFVRLTGCPLRCHWCDTAYAFSGGERMALDRILENVAGFGLPAVCVTGGEPLAQPACLPLLSALCDQGYRVSLETSGALDIGNVDPRVLRVIDLKPPGSGEVARNRWENLAHLRPEDELKFVLADAEDYAWARAIIDEHLLHQRCALLFSPVAGQLPPAQLAEWIVRDRLPVRFQLQLHKILWQDARGR